MLKFSIISKTLLVLWWFAHGSVAMNPSLPLEHSHQIIEELDDNELCALALVDKYNHVLVCHFRAGNLETPTDSLIPPRPEDLRRLMRFFQLAPQIYDSWLDGKTPTMKGSYREILNQVNIALGRTLNYFARSSMSAEFRSLADASVDANVPLTANDSRTALFLAMHEDNEGAATLLLTAPTIDVNRKDEYGRTPLMIALSRPTTSKALHLLLNDARLDVNACNNHGCTALHITHNASNIKEVLQHPDIILTISDKSGRAPLHTAALKGHLDSLRLILDHKDCDIHDRNNQGRGDTALHEAAAFAQPQVIVALIDRGADINMFNNQNETPLFCAVFSSYGKPEMAAGTIDAVKVLLDHPNIDVDKGDVLARAREHQNLCGNVKKVYQFMLTHPKFKK